MGGVVRVSRGGGHAAQQIGVVLVAIGLEIEIGGQLGQPLVAHLFDVLLHETIVSAPRNSVGAHGRLLGARRDLMGVLVMEIEMVDQRLLDLLVQQQIAVDRDVAAAVAEGRRQMAIDIDALAVAAVAGEIGNVVRAVDRADAVSDGVQRPVEHQARNVSVWDAQLLMRGDRVAAILRHRPLQNENAAPPFRAKRRRSSRPTGGR